MKKLAARPRGTIGIVDIGTSKVCCFIARRQENEPHIIGIGHQISRGVRNGVIVDIDAASHSILTAINTAEQMAGETLSEVVVNMSGGFGTSRIVKTEVHLNGREVSDSDMRRVLDQGRLAISVDDPFNAFAGFGLGVDNRARIHAHAGALAGRFYK